MKAVIRKWQRSLGLIVACLSLLTACSQTARYKILSTFFDGVPDPNAVEIKEEKAQDQQGGFSSTVAANAHDAGAIILHVPFQEKSCDSCHDFQGTMTSNLQQRELCFSCHDDFTASYEYVHGPVAGGFCTQCHNPHKSQNKKLLLRTGQDLCLYCHERNDVLGSETHEGLGEESCTDCHNPHGGEEPYFFN